MVVVLETTEGFVVRSPDVPFYSGGATKLDALYNFATDLRNYISTTFNN